MGAPCYLYDVWMNLKLDKINAFLKTNIPASKLKKKTKRFVDSHFSFVTVCMHVPMWMPGVDVRNSLPPLSTLHFYRIVFICLHVSMSLYMLHMCADTCRGQKRAAGSMDLKKILKTELVSSEKILSILGH